MRRGQARPPVTGPALVAVALIVSWKVEAGGVSRAIIDAQGALIEVATGKAVSLVSRSALTTESIGLVHAACLGPAVVEAQGTLVTKAGLSVSGVSGLTVAAPAAWEVRAGGVR